MSDIKLLTNLSGTPASGQWDFRRAKVTVELDMSNPTNIRGMQLSSAGLVFYKGKDVFLGIPWADLWKLAESAEPKFLPNQPGKA